MEEKEAGMKNTYEVQILNTCIQTYYNLNGVMPGTPELIEMLGEDYMISVSLNSSQAA